MKTSLHPNYEYNVEITKLEEDMFPRRLPSSYDNRENKTSEFCQTTHALPEKKSERKIKLIPNQLKKGNIKLSSQHNLKLFGKDISATKMKLTPVQNITRLELKRRNFTLNTETLRSLWKKMIQEVSCAKSNRLKNSFENTKVHPRFEISNQSYLIYHGNFNDQGLPHGKNGFMKWENGDLYVGTFWNGMREGFGTLQCSDGSEYFGQWSCDVMHGKGTYRFPDGSIYKGPYFRGIRNGKDGQFFSPNNGSCIEDFANSKLEGGGILHYQNGDIYEGSIVDGKRHGAGTYYNHSGETIISSYLQDRPVGIGILWNKNQTKAWLFPHNKITREIGIQEASGLTTLILSQNGPKFVKENFLSQTPTMMDIPNQDDRVLCDSSNPRLSGRFSTSNNTAKASRDGFSKQTPKKKTVSFLEEDEVHTIESRDCSDEEHHIRWYTRKEIILLQHSSARKLLQEMKRSYTFCTQDEKDEEVRGIEHLQSCKIYKDARRKRKFIVKEVLRIQDLQQSNDSSNEDRLSSTHCKLSETGKRKAIEFGQSDARSAAKIYNEADLLPTLSSSFDCSYGSIFSSSEQNYELPGHTGLPQ